MNNIYLFKDGKYQKLEVEENIDEMLKEPKCEANKRYTDMGYSIVTYNGKDCTTSICVDVKEDDLTNIGEIINGIKEENSKIYNYQIFNHLINGDYDSVNRLNQNEILPFITSLVYEKLGKLDSMGLQDCRFFRELSLEGCFLGSRYNHSDRFPNNKDCGTFIIKPDSIDLLGLNKRTHEELIQERENTTSRDLYTNKNTIVGIIVKNSVMIFAPNEINDYQKERLREIDERIQDFKSFNHMPVYVDVAQVKNGEPQLINNIDLLLKEKNRTM